MISEPLNCGCGFICWKHAATKQHLRATVQSTSYSWYFFVEMTWTRDLNGWRFFEGLLRIESFKLRRREEVNNFSRSEPILVLGVARPSDPVGPGKEEMVILETHGLIDWLDSWSFGYQWKMSTPRMLKKKKEKNGLSQSPRYWKWAVGTRLRLLYCSVEMSRANEDYRHFSHDIIAFITYTLYLYCACFRRKRRMKKNAILRCIYRIFVIHRT